MGKPAMRRRAPSFWRLRSHRRRAAWFQALWRRQRGLRRAAAPAAFVFCVLCAIVGPAALPFTGDAVTAGRSGWSALAASFLGLRICFAVGVVAMIVSLSLGVFLGISAAILGGAYERGVWRVMAAQKIAPRFFIALFAVGALTPLGWFWAISLGVGLSDWPRAAYPAAYAARRAVRSNYAAAARVMGLSRRRVFWRHVAPNAAAPALATYPELLAAAMGTEAALAYLRLGVAAMETPPVSLGALIYLGQNAIANGDWWPAGCPLALLTLAVVSCATLGARNRRRIARRAYEEPDWAETI